MVPACRAPACTASCPSAPPLLVVAVDVSASAPAAPEDSEANVIRGRLALLKAASASPPVKPLPLLVAAAAPKPLAAVLVPHAEPLLVLEPPKPEPRELPLPKPLVVAPVLLPNPKPVPLPKPSPGGAAVPVPRLVGHAPLVLLPQEDHPLELPNASPAAGASFLSLAAVELLEGSALLIFNAV